ncbi:hydroxymethylbilane synthase [bacterium]|nr:hydroxymethylbilane synthase [bacterium]
MRIIIGSRASQLALIQANWVVEQLRRFCPEIAIKKIKTKGDAILDSPLSKIGGKGLFVKEIEDALLNKEIDLAVHSMKDVPTDLPGGLTIGAVTERLEPRDVLISKDKCKLNELGRGSLIGTSSPRRKAQILAYRGDLKAVDLRGNLSTRLKKLETTGLSAIVVAAAGLIRMGLRDRIAQTFPTEIMLPAPGQGALGIEIRDGDKEIRTLVSNLNEPDSLAAITAERSFLKALGGGCQVPIGALGKVEDRTLRLQGIVASLDGTRLLRSKVKGPKEEAEEIGKDLAKTLINSGAGEILAHDGQY